MLVWYFLVKLWCGAVHQFSTNQTFTVDSGQASQYIPGSIEILSTVKLLGTNLGNTFFFCLFIFTGWFLKASASRAEDPGFESRLRRNFSGVESYQLLKNWHFSGCPARRLALQCQCWDWLARCQYTVIGWGKKFIYSFYLSVAARTIVWADLSLRYTSILLGR